MTAPPDRPRPVTIAFFLWLVAAILLVLLGLLLVSSRYEVPGVVRGLGAVWIAVGLALGWLAGKARSGDPRYRRAAIALTLTASVLLVLFIGPLTVAIVIPAVAGAILAQRPAANAWFDTVAAQREGVRGD